VTRVFRMWCLLVLSACSRDTTDSNDTDRTETDAPTDSDRTGLDTSDSDLSDSADDTTTIRSLPEAVCEASPAIVNVEVPMQFRGGGSSDPEGQPITNFNWSLIQRPAGSVVDLALGGSATKAFTPDVPGVYVASLTVMATDGRVSDPCLATLTAVGPGLEVEISWDLPDDDMDLHVLEPGGVLNGDGDCYSGNCETHHLHWGTASATDDPNLDVDAIYGTGPETMHIPLPAMGTYTLLVLDHPTRVVNGSNTVTMTVHSDGTVIWTGSRILTDEGEQRAFATITFPGAVVVPL